MKKPGVMEEGDFQQIRLYNEGSGKCITKSYISKNMDEQDVHG